MEPEVTRCDWALKTDIEKAYHDKVWGVPEYDDKKLFKMLMLEGMQAGLSWVTVLKKMDAICEAFDDFIPEIVAYYDEEKEMELMQNAGIIRNRRKIRAVTENAAAYLRLCEECGSFSAYLWSFVGGQPIVNSWHSMSEVPAHTEISDKLSADLKKRGFKFVGSTIVYAFMQAVGMVNDHLVRCDFRNN